MPDEFSSKHETPQENSKFPAFLQIRHRPGARVEFSVRTEGDAKISKIEISMDEYLDLLQKEAQIIPKVMAAEALVAPKPNILHN